MQEKDMSKPKKEKFGAIAPNFMKTRKKRLRLER